MASSAERTVTPEWKLQANYKCLFVNPVKRALLSGTDITTN